MSGAGPGGGRLAGRAAIVTGGGRGIGRAIAGLFAAEGAALMLAGRNEAALARAAEELRESGATVEYAATDVRDETAVERMTAAAIERLGKIDVLVNNAGIAGPAALVSEIDAADWNETLDINLTGAFLCAKHAARHMIERGGGGTIVNISSIAGRIGYALRTPYAASKWGMIGLSHSLAAELGAYGIRVNCVCPGATAGERIERVLRDRAAAEGSSVEVVKKSFVGPAALGRLVTAGEVARGVLYFACDESSGVTGQVVNVDAGFRMQ